MSDLKGAFDSLYTELLLRDLGAKVAPGIIVLTAVRVAMTGTQSTVDEIKAATLGIWIIAVAVAWLTGLGVQGLGEILGKVGDWCPKLAFLPVRYYPASKTWADWADLFRRFDTATMSKPIQQQRFERLVVIREATGNGCVAVGIAIAVLALTKPMSPVLWVGGVLALVGLAVLHQGTAKRLWEYTEIVIDKSNTTST